MIYEPLIGSEELAEEVPGVTLIRIPLTIRALDFKIIVQCPIATQIKSLAKSIF